MISRLYEIIEQANINKESFNVIKNMNDCLYITVSGSDGVYKLVYEEKEDKAVLINPKGLEVNEFRYIISEENLNIKMAVLIVNDRRIGYIWANSVNIKKYKNLIEYKFYKNDEFYAEFSSKNANVDFEDNILNIKLDK